MRYLNEVEVFLTGMDEILLEAFPPIFLELPHSVKKIISKTFTVGPDSKQSEIKKIDATKSPYSKGLLITTDSDFNPMGYIIGANIGNMPDNDETYENRADMLNKANHIYYISPDEKTFGTLGKREERGPIDPTKFRELETKRMFDKHIKTYMEKKIDELEKIALKVKKKIESILKKQTSKFLKSQKTNNRETTFELGEKFNILLERFKEYDNTIFNIIDNDYSNINPTNIGEKLQELNELKKSLIKELNKR